MPFLRLEVRGFIGVEVTRGLGLRLIRRSASVIRRTRSSWRKHSLRSRLFMSASFSALLLQLFVTSDPMKGEGAELCVTARVVRRVVEASETRSAQDLSHTRSI